MAFELTEGQRKAIAVMQRGGSLLLTGAAGTGKSTALRHFLNSVADADRSRVATTAMVGIAATLIDGVTFHSWFGIGKCEEHVLDLLKKIMDSPFTKGRIRSVTTVITDEISLMSATMFDKTEMLARRVRGDPKYVASLLDRWKRGVKMTDDDIYKMYPGDEPYGGIQFICIGDFAQLPPIDDALKKTYDNGESGERDLFAFTAKMWSSVIKNPIDLTEVMRQADESFVGLLNALRRGGPLSAEQQALLESRVFTDPLTAPQPPVDGMERTVLYPHREDVEHINTVRLKALVRMNAAMLELPEDEYNEHAQAKAVKFQAIVKVVRRHIKRPHEDDKKIKEIAIKRVPCHMTLIIAVGAQVMLKYNMDVKLGLANGSRGVVKRLIADSNGVCVGAVVDFVSTKGVIITAHEFDVKIDDHTKVVIQQIPLILAYAMTIHQCIGSTIDCVEANLKNCFAYGQVYTAISRVRSLDDLVITSLDISKIKAHPLVKTFYGWD